MVRRAPLASIVFVARSDSWHDVHGSERQPQQTSNEREIRTTRRTNAAQSSATRVLQ